MPARFAASATAALLRRTALRPTPTITATPSILPKGLRQASSFLEDQPAPPRLPAEQQAEFERLQRAAEAALNSHTTTEAAPPLATSRYVSSPSAAAPTQSHDGATAPPVAEQEQEQEEEETTFSSGMRQGAPPEFHGPKNPKTGEVGGPKNEPLRWGSASDWSYNGRVTDF
ncbi:hypothetical protein B0T24DRAFT_626857 [Lasiosphaeria ovina]|uniref:Succinate dehydrogenase assembly factor 4, mitochondrial n=1 Tax=Lasiosphaeria ovina TaxID=92902 RepID=A0AAE0K7E3_9PEZI|nr:hypothetical protein B0T24DRAFT_626857 [Lasiosphaeria ovina]